MGPTDCGNLFDALAPQSLRGLTQLRLDDNGNPRIQSRVDVSLSPQLQVLSLRGVKLHNARQLESLEHLVDLDFRDMEEEVAESTLRISRLQHLQRLR